MIVWNIRIINVAPLLEGDARIDEAREFGKDFAGGFGMRRIFRAALKIFIPSPESQTRAGRSRFIQYAHATTSEK